jgi:hypothetical protein
MMRLSLYLQLPPLFFVVKCHAADATDAPLPRLLLCNRVLKMIGFFPVFRVTDYQWNITDRGKLMHLGEKPVPVPLRPPQIP